MDAATPSIDDPPETAPADARARWNPGGWFGGTLGPILFLPFGASALRDRSPACALLLLGMFAAAVALSLLLWTRRARLSIGRALLVVIPLVCVFNVSGGLMFYHFGLSDPFEGLESLRDVPGWGRLVFFGLLFIVIARLQNRRRSGRP